MGDIFRWDWDVGRVCDNGPSAYVAASPDTYKLSLDLRLDCMISEFTNR